TEQDDANNEVILRVSDNGKGIEDTETVFEPFHSEKLHAGTGLGLSIAKKIVEMHSGSIDVQSLPGEGSIFTVRLPIQ
ncbi:MAG: HAMP domain-containing sensor histidine kinase, partial [Planctomycetota bacterium]|nr:HAMP domain-containing sensor histidine kinase [Planctomycetota bacterium]